MTYTVWYSYQPAPAEGYGTPPTMYRADFLTEQAANDYAGQLFSIGVVWTMVQTITP